MQIGLCAPTNKIEQVKSFGYDYIELSGIEIMSMSQKVFQDFVVQKEALHYPVMGFNAYCNGTTPMVGEAFSEQKVRRYAAEICERGASLGIQFLDIGAPAARMLPTGYDVEKADAQCKRFLEITAQEAEPYGIYVLFEALHHKCCNYANHTADALRLIKELDIDHVRINLDFYHMEIMGEQMEDLSCVMPYVRHLHYNHISPGKLDREFITPDDRPALHKIKQAIAACCYDGTFSVEPDHTPQFDHLAPISYVVMKEIFK